MSIMAFRLKCAKRRHLDRTYNRTSVYTGNDFADVCVCLYGERSHCPWSQYSWEGLEAMPTDTYLVF